MDYESAMLLAYDMATASLDPSTQNGAVLLDFLGDPIGTGWNHFPDGVDEKYWHGEKADKYARVVHAEVSAIIDAARLGKSVIGSTLVCPWAACSNCAKHVADAGVKRLVRHSYSNNGVTTGSHWYEDCLIGDEIFNSVGLEIIEIDPIPTTITLRRDGKQWP